jgi:hypothetical protein
MGTEPLVPVANVPSGPYSFNQSVETTSASQSVTLGNAGNAPLVVSSIVTSNDFGQTNNCGGAVAAGYSCTINVTFSPTVTGSLYGALTITDKCNGVPGSMQTAGLRGTGSTGSESQTITFGALSNQAFGIPPFTISATASSGLPVIFNSQTPAVCAVSGATVTLVSVGTCTIQATQAGNANCAATPVNESFK